MNNNTLKINGRSVILNGVPVNCVTDYQIGTDVDNYVLNCCISFDIYPQNLEFSSEPSEEPSQKETEEISLETSSTADLLSELKNRKAIHVEYDCLNEESFIFGKYDGKIQ